MALVEIEPVPFADSNYWLEAATDPDDDTTVDLLFKSEELARKAATNLIKEFSWIQLSEWGEWQLNNGRPRQAGSFSGGQKRVDITPYQRQRPVSLVFPKDKPDRESILQLRGPTKTNFL